MDVTDWDSNYGENTQMLPKENQITTSCHVNQGGGRIRGNLSAFSVHLSFYKLLFSILNYVHFKVTVAIKNTVKHIYACSCSHRNSFPIVLLLVSV